jgi:regulator of sigma E protease
MDVLTTIFYFAITIVILVFVHELGHFLAAKLCGMRVERFSIGFPPKLVSKKIGDTEYTIALIPLGGYVKISGMVDESLDTEFQNREPQPWEYRAKPLYQRAFVISAGVLMNAALAVAIFWGINFAQGKLVDDTTEIGYVASGSPAYAAGLQENDKILKINRREISHWGDVERTLNTQTLGQNLTLVVERDGIPRTLNLPAESNITSPREQFGIVQQHTRAVVAQVMADSPAEEIGMQPGDRFISVNHEPITNELQVIRIISAHPEQEVFIEWERNGEVFSTNAVPTDEGRIGIVIGREYTGPKYHIQYGFFGAIPAGIRDMFEMLGLLLHSIWLMITGTLSFSENVAGPIMIANMASQTAEAGILSFIYFVGLLSITLAFINILPFPVLDGGHLMYIVYEMIFRREVPPKIQIALQQIGFVLILALMAFVIYNDIMRL